jgi:hypothetical protein
MLTNNQAGIDIREIMEDYCIFKIVNNKTYIPLWLEEAFIDNYDINYNGTNEFNIDIIDIETIVNTIENFYWVSKWYDLIISDGIKTPLSIFIEKSENNIGEKIDEAINKLGGKAFIRLDTASSKNLIFHINNTTVFTDLSSSERTRPTLTNNKKHNIVIRKYLDDINNMYEIRCFICKGILRGMSGLYDTNIKLTNIQLLKLEINKFIKRVICATEYKDCTIDIIINKNDCNDFLISDNIKIDIILLEINSPVSLLATSGLFNLSLPFDRELLCGPINEFINYPQFILSNNNGKIIRY